METLAHARDENERAAATRQLETGVQRAIRLIEQLLAIARHGQPVAAGTGDVALDALARDVVAGLVPLADKRNIDLGVAEAEHASVHGDRDALETLLRNLIDNAVRYTPEGGRVDVAVRSRQREGRPFVVLSVADTGPGIPPAERTRVFDRFHRVPGTTAPGSGLGLAIVRSIAEAHEAAVTLEDADGHGLRVSVAFPAGRPS
jgi:two-component system OmpR family sensor kinase